MPSAHVRADGEGEHLAQQADGAVGDVGTAVTGDLAVQGVDVRGLDFVDLGVREVRTDVPCDQHPIVPRSVRAQRRLDVLGHKALDQLGHGRRVALGLDVGEGIAALVDEAAKPLGLGACCGRLPVGTVAYGVAALAAGSRPVRENERPMAGGGDATAEAGDGVVVIDLIALHGRWQPLDRRVGEMVSHGAPSCPRRVRSKNSTPCPTYGEGCLGCQRKNMIFPGLSSPFSDETVPAQWLGLGSRNRCATIRSAMPRSACNGT